MIGLMPTYAAPSADGVAGPAGAHGLKIIYVTPDNPAAGLDAHQGIVLLSSAQTGEPLAVLDASAITEIRTAAVSVVATGLLARPGATELAIVGTGVQGRAHLLSLAAARPPTGASTAGRDPGTARPG